jgi:hypothetical protein
MKLPSLKSYETTCMNKPSFIERGSMHCTTYVSPTFRSFYIASDIIKVSGIVCPYNMKSFRHLMRIDCF